VHSKAYSELYADLRLFTAPHFLRQCALKVISDAEVSLPPADLKASQPEIKKNHFYIRTVICNSWRREIGIKVGGESLHEALSK